MHAVQPVDEQAFHDALAALVDRPGLSATERNEQIDGLFRFAKRRGLSLEHCLVAREGKRIVASCLCIDAPGRTSSVMIPANIEKEEVGDAVVDLLGEMIRLGGERNVQILQAMVEPHARLAPRLLHRVGFERLAELIYLDCDLTTPLPASPCTTPVGWTAYSDQVHDLFARVVQGSYEGSLDCVQLNGVRHIEDILASHRATGEFDPHFWLIGTVDSGPVGAILLAYLPERWAYEVAYMGLLPAWRGRGYGSVLLRKAIELAREKAGFVLTLAVDAQNTPARKLYGRFGFCETFRREVWIKVLGSDDTSLKR